MGGGLRDGGVGEGEGEGGAVVPGGELVEEPGAGGVAGLAEDEVEGAVVEVGEVGGEALGGAEGAADLLDGGAVAALRAGRRCRWGRRGGGARSGGLGEEGVLDVEGVDGAVAPVGEVGGGVGVGEAVGDGGGEEVVPGGVGGGEPAGGGVHEELLVGVGLFAPVRRGTSDLPSAGAPGLADGFEVGGKEERPEGGVGAGDDGGGRRVGVHAAVPGAEEVGGLVKSLALACCMGRAGLSSAWSMA